MHLLAALPSGDAVLPIRRPRQGALLGGWKPCQRGLPRPRHRLLPRRPVARVPSPGSGTGLAAGTYVYPDIHPGPAAGACPPQICPRPPQPARGTVWPPSGEMPRPDGADPWPPPWMPGIWAQETRFTPEPCCSRAASLPLGFIRPLPSAQCDTDGFITVLAKRSRLAAANGWPRREGSLGRHRWWLGHLVAYWSRKAAASTASR